MLRVQKWKFKSCSVVLNISKFCNASGKPLCCGDIPSTTAKGPLTRLSPTETGMGEPCKPQHCQGTTAAGAAPAVALQTQQFPELPWGWLPAISSCGICVWSAGSWHTSAFFQCHHFIWLQKNLTALVPSTPSADKFGWSGPTGSKVLQGRDEDINRVWVVKPP